MSTFRPMDDPAPAPPPLMYPALAPAAPLSQSERITSLDTLRGFALLGILILNIQAFAMPGAAYMNPTAYGDLNGANYWVWYLGHLLAEQKFMTIFSMLFGAGIVVMTSRIEGTGRSSAGIHYRRMGWLILFGLLHAHLLWYGDILYFYGMCGLAAWVFRKVPPGVLIALGLIAIAVPSMIEIGLGLAMPHWPQESLQEFAYEWAPPDDMIAEEIDAYQGGWRDQMSQRVPTSFWFETFLFAMWGAWRAGGLMLVGMALFKLGVFSAQRSSRYYLSLIVAALVVGLPVVLYGVHRNFSAGWDVRYSMFLGSQFNYWGSLVVSLGWIGLVMLLCQSPAWSFITRPLGAVGQMALTNYLLHTMICTTIFYGHGLGLFGQVERVGQILIVLAIWAVQLIISPLWLKRFQFGPMEWLWRSLTYWKPQPMRRAPLSPAVAL